MKPFDGQLVGFDITIPCQDRDNWQPQKSDILTSLLQLAKKFVFQLECGDSDYFHFQVRLHLHKKTCYGTLLRDLIPQCKGHWSVTANGTHLAGNQFNYVMKTQSHIEGPWTEDDVPDKPKTLTRQLRHYMTLDPYPWQVKATALASSYNERHLTYIWDPHYNSGKSIFSEWLEYKGLAEEIPPFTLMEDIMQFVMGQKTSGCYLFDMPAAMKKERMHQMYSGLEMLKNGYLYDKRYQGKKRRIDRPTVICFANNLPITDLMAPDRWQVYYLTRSKDLVLYDPFQHPEPEPVPQFDD